MVFSSFILYCTRLQPHFFSLIVHFFSSIIAIGRSLSILIFLTLKYLSYFSLPFVHKGVQVDPLIEYFSVGISVRNLHHMCMHLKRPYISKKNDQKCFVLNWRQKKQIFVLRKKTRDQNLKNYFSKGIFQ